MIGFMSEAGSLSSTVCAGSLRGHLPRVGFTWATAHYATESGKPLQDVTRSSLQIKL